MWDFGCAELVDTDCNESKCCYQSVNMIFAFDTGGTHFRSKASMSSRVNAALHIVAFLHSSSTSIHTLMSNKPLFIAVQYIVHVLALPGSVGKAGRLPLSHSCCKLGPASGSHCVQH